jgi:hypothetical protein
LDKKAAAMMQMHAFREGQRGQKISKTFSEY